MRDIFCEPDANAVPMVLVSPAKLETWQSSLDAKSRPWVAANGFTGKDGQSLRMPDADGRMAGVLIGAARPDDIYALASAQADLPPGDYRIETPLDSEAATRLALGWGLANYRFTRYRAKDGPLPRLAWPDQADRARVLREVAAVHLVRDLVNTPANDLGPAALAETARAIAAKHNARCDITVGDLR